MIGFDNFIKEDTSPIYMQIITYIKRGIVSGAVAEGDELPSRRVLSARLGVNPNTVQKAYKILEDEKIISSQAGAKSLIIIDDEARIKIREELLESDAVAAVVALRQMGLTKEEAIALLEKHWDEVIK